MSLSNALDAIFASNLTDPLKQQCRDLLKRDINEAAFIVDSWNRSKVANPPDNTILDDYLTKMIATAPTTVVDTTNGNKFT
ncbi:hypothetical protein PPL_06929 [Heterostelium album PN500]|uniref:Uncharacterized protein n=1 Tax=Heterostelium pallidum (strain ATCC 26659 / Pp 5 / PN500) TaxID=670386 RepID=D3BDX6_HETP5|nr:hypothetical protein PPL_06929 [Heterostelium album PN500]EFA80107.1 hypothetical protein PPL_06929 [Heterostelium album PN500]|eukprot:XP_020432227.1 hypothetical protein PPL_06929 [Heterostelium album PN500]